MNLRAKFFEVILSLLSQSIVIKNEALVILAVSPELRNFQNVYDNL